MSLWQRLSRGLDRSRAEDDLERELRGHLELETEERRETGVSPEEARYGALRALGNTDLVKEQVREAWGWMWLDRAVQDLRHALRQLRRNPGFTAVAVLTLALGIGANTAIFTLVHAVMLRALPVDKPEQLYSLGDNVICCDTGQLQDSFTLYSHALYQQLRVQTPELSDIVAFQSWLQNLSVRRSGSRDLAQPYKGEIVSGNYFSMLGVKAFAGRGLTPEDDRPNAQPVAVMSYRAWRQRFALDRAAIGSSLIMNGQPVTVVGIAPPGFFGETLQSDPPDFWVPLAMEPSLAPDNPLLRRPDIYWLYAIGRLKPGARPAAVEARLTAEIHQWLGAQAVIAERDRPRLAKVHMVLTPAGGGIAGIRSAYGSGLRLLMAVSLLVLLIACANIANLLVVRGMAARLQTAVRVALGAGRMRIVRQMLTEGVTLALLGGVAGTAIAFAGTRALLALAFRGAEYVPIDPNPSLPVLAFALLLSLLTGVVASATPVWLASHTQPTEPLRGAGRSTRTQSALPQKSLLVLQGALSVVLLAGAGLLTQSLRHLENQRFGFETRGRLIVRLNPALDGYTPAQLPALYQKLTERLPQIPGVASASIALHSPLDDWDWGTRVSIAGRPPANDPAADRSWYDRVSAHYFETLGTRLLRGRVIDEHDTTTSRHVAVVTQAFVRRFFPHGDPLGSHFGTAAAGHSGDFEIVGVVEDAKYRDERASGEVMFFLPLLQKESYQDARTAAYQTWSSYIDSLQLRVAGDPAGLAPAVRRALAEIAPNLTVLKVLSLDEQVGMRFNGPRLVARLTALYGLLALILASVGLYGVAAYTVTRRTGEIGIRMALGARRASVIAMVLRGATSPIAIGLAIGVPAALAGGSAIASQLYGVQGYDSAVLGTAVGVLAVCALAAAVVPARRAASIDPVRALRTE